MVQFTEVVAAGPGWTTVRTADGRTVTLQGARNWRNNNPGNLEYGPTARGYGAVGTDGRFAVFNDYNAGRAAKEGLLFENPRYSTLTIRDAIAKYAPPVENNTTAYVNAITSSIGVPASTPLSDLTEEQRSVMLDTMQRVEGFRPGKAKGILGDPLDANTLQIDPQYGSIPDSVPVPEMRPGLGQVDSAVGMMSVIDPVSVTPVQRGLLDTPTTETAGMLGPAAFDTARFGEPAPAFDMGRFGAPVEQAPAFDMARFGEATPSFDSARFGQPETVANGFDVRRFGSMSPMNVDAMASAAGMAPQQPAQAQQAQQAQGFDPSRFGNMTEQPQGMAGLRDALAASNAQMAAPSGGLLGNAQAAQPTAPSSPPGMAEQYGQYGQGQLAMQQAMAPSVAAANLAADVADQQGLLASVKTGRLPAMTQPTQPGYVDPAVNAQPQVTAPMQAAPAMTPAPAMAAPAQAARPAAAAGATPTGPELGRLVERQMMTRSLLGGIGGGLLGGALLGPVGAAVGGLLGRNVAKRSYYPPAPTAQSKKSDKKFGYGDLNDYGREAYDSSSQVRDVVDNDRPGLW